MLVVYLDLDGALSAEFATGWASDCKVGAGALGASSGVYVCMYLTLAYTFGGTSTSTRAYTRPSA